jgi:hypothetical protein
MKYKPHRRYRQSVVVDAPLKVRIKRLPSPRPKDVARAKKEITKRIAKYGTKRYKRRRQRADEIVEEVLTRHNIKGTSSYEYWRLALLCDLIGM